MNCFYIFNPEILPYRKNLSNTELQIAWVIKEYEEEIMNLCDIWKEMCD